VLVHHLRVRFEGTTRKYAVLRRITDRKPRVGQTTPFYRMLLLLFGPFPTQILGNLCGNFQNFQPTDEKKYNSTLDLIKFQRFCKKT
jgi:hypothetical protein